MNNLAFHTPSTALDMLNSFFRPSTKSSVLSVPVLSHHFISLPLASTTFLLTALHSHRSCSASLCLCTLHYPIVLLSPLPFQLHLCPLFITSAQHPPQSSVNCQMLLCLAKSWWTLNKFSMISKLNILLIVLILFLNFQISSILKWYVLYLENNIFAAWA